MDDFPKWLLALAALSLTPLLCCVFFLFGAKPFGTPAGGGAMVELLLYIATQLLWVVPAVLFFVSLDRYRRGFTRSGVALVVLGDALAVLAFALLAA